MLIVVILHVCMLIPAHGEPQGCFSHRLAEPASFVECMIQGQQIGHRYFEEHPELKLYSWSCEPESLRDGKEAKQDQPWSPS